MKEFKILPGLRVTDLGNLLQRCKRESCRHWNLDVCKLVNIIYKGHGLILLGNTVA